LGYNPGYANLAEGDLPNLISDFLFLIQRLNWLSLLDLFLVALIFFAILIMVRDTQAVILLRGVIFIVVLISLLTMLVDLPAFSFLVRNTLPALLFAIPVIFSPEIRRALEKVGRAGSGPMIVGKTADARQRLTKMVDTVVTASSRLSARQHGALIVLQRGESLTEYVRTGVRLDAEVTPELLLQVFYPNTPLHDGAVIIADGRVLAGACVMPLSASGILNRSPDRQMGLRHRAALGITEVSDAVAVVVSEQTGSISVAHGGHMIRRLDNERLQNVLMAFHQQAELPFSLRNLARRVLRRPLPGPFQEE
jgi:diadenylate cyclase